METYQIPNGKSYRNWQAVFDDAQPLPWTALIPVTFMGR